MSKIKIKYILLILFFTIVYLFFIQPMIECNKYTRDYAMKQMLIYINKNFSSKLKYNRILKESKEDPKVASNVSGMVDRYLYICYSKDSNSVNKIEEIRQYCKKDVKREYLENYLKLFSH